MYTIKKVHSVHFPCVNSAIVIIFLSCFFSLPCNTNVDHVYVGNERKSCCLPSFLPFLHLHVSLAPSHHDTSFKRSRIVSSSSSPSHINTTVELPLIPREKTRFSTQYRHIRVLTELLSYSGVPTRRTGLQRAQT